jgi:DNA-binding PadR family transcriptional regulator
MPRANLGELEEQVLLVLIRLGGEGYAVQVADSLGGSTGREASPATTFMVMRRLEARGLVKSRVDAADPSWGGRPRRFYRVNLKLAVPLLRASRRARLALWTGLEAMLK